MSLASRFQESYQARRDEALAAGESDDAALEAALRDFAERGAAAWPAVALPAEVLAGYLGERAPVDVPPSDWLAGARAADLFLACACAEGLPPALRAFDAAFVGQIGAYLRALRPTPQIVADTTQELLEKLFVGLAGGPPRIRQYTGQGALGAWVRVAAVRTAHDLIEAQKPGQRRSDDVDELAGAVVPRSDPEVEILEARYRGEFMAAFRDAMAALSPRERALLRFTFVDRLPPARLGVIYGVHRTTAMRWVKEAQEEVLSRTRARMMERLHLSPSECDSLVAVLKSRIDITLSSILEA
jgi:RNA polymerase sigma-70 factor (ECF subfamily)